MMKIHWMRYTYAEIVWLPKKDQLHCCLPIRLKKVAGAEGFEPSNDGTKTRCLTNLATPQSLQGIVKNTFARIKKKRERVPRVGFFLIQSENA